MDKEQKAAIEAIAKYSEMSTDNPSNFDRILALLEYQPSLGILKDELIKKQITLEASRVISELEKRVKYYHEQEKSLTVNYNFDEHIVLSNPEETSLIIDESKRIQRIVTDIYRDNTSLFTLDPRVFEELIAELLSHQGFKVELTKQTRDNGYDIIAIHNINNHLPIKFLVECKRYVASRKVGVEIIRSFKEVIETEGANRGIIVTTSYFTSGAIKKQEEIPHILDLKAKDDLMNWVYDYYISRLGK